MADYKVRLYDRSGALKFELVNFRGLVFSKGVNEAGMASLTLESSHPATAELGLDWQMEVWRREPSVALDWYVEYTGLLRDAERRASDAGLYATTYLFPGILSLLGRAIVAYPTGTSGRSAFSGAKAESIAKALVTYNATAAGSLADGRFIAAGVPWVTVASDAASGPALDFSCPYRNLLSALADLAAVGGGDFDLVRAGALAWEFRWYPGQRGADRRNSVVFSLGYGNMSSPSLRWNTLDERTVAVVGGQGEEAARLIVVRTGANYAAGYGAAELFADARLYSTVAGLEAAGDAVLQEAQGRVAIQFEVIQTASSFYGLHYGLGDIVTARVEEYVAVKKIIGVAIEVSSAGERIAIRTEDA